MASRQRLAKPVFGVSLKRLTEIGTLFGNANVEKDGKPCRLSDQASSLDEAQGLIRPFGDDRQRRKSD